MDKADARSRLLNAAGPVFAEHGFKAATVREICQRAGVNVASVNYYFGDKETLYFETVRRARQLRAEQFPIPERPPGTSPEVRLRDFITTMIHRMLAADQASWNTRLMLREVLDPTGVCPKLVEQYFRPQFEMLLGILREMLPTTVPTHVVRKIGFGLVGQCLHYRVAGEVVTALTPAEEYAAHYDLGQIADHITRTCLAALGVTPPIGADVEQPTVP